MDQDKFIAAIEGVRKDLQRAKLRFAICNRDPRAWRADFEAAQAHRGPDSHHYMDAQFQVQPLGFWGECVTGYIRQRTGRGLEISTNWSSGGRDSKELPCCLDAADEHARAVKVLTTALRRAKSRLADAGGAA